MAEHKQVISVSVDDSAARRSLEELVKRLERANQLAGNLGVGGGQGQPLAGAAPSSTAGSGQTAGGAAPKAGDGTSTTARPTGPPAPPQGMEKAVMMGRTGVAAGGAAASAAIGYAQGISQDPGWAIRTTGRMIRDLTSAAAAGVTAIAESIPEAAQLVPKVAAASMTAVIAAQATKVAGEAIGAGLEFVAEGVSVRFQNLQRIAGMERPIETSRQLGGIETGLGSDAMAAGISFGFGPEESVQMWQSYLQQIGVKGAGEVVPAPFQSAVSGISPGMMARYLGLGGPGGGARGGIQAAAANLPGAIGLATGFGMTGSKVDEFLARISTATTMMAEQGLSLNLASVNQLTADLEATGAQAAGRTGGRNVFAGMNAVRGSLALQQMGPQASRGFLGQFSGLRDMALFSYAAQQTGGDYLSAIEYMQGMDGQETQVALSSMLPTEAATAAFASSGSFSVAQGRVLAGGRQRGSVPRSLGGARPSALPLSRQIAAQDQALLQQASGLAGNEEIIRSVFQIQQMLQTISAMGGPVIEKANSLMLQLSQSAALYLRLHGG